MTYEELVAKITENTHLQEKDAAKSVDAFLNLVKAQSNDRRHMSFQELKQLVEEENKE
ncbi:MAG: HU family DNA-binding protein [Lachnospira sp.]|nr:HU family DNA-binding protein [Lachnospira sp.]